MRTTRVSTQRQNALDNLDTLISMLLSVRDADPNDFDRTQAFRAFVELDSTMRKAVTDEMLCAILYEKILQFMGPKLQTNAALLPILCVKS